MINDEGDAGVCWEWRQVERDGEKRGEGGEGAGGGGRRKIDKIRLISFFKNIHKVLTQ